MTKVKTPKENLGPVQRLLSALPTLDLHIFSLPNRCLYAPLVA
ncbi:MAG TPA: hypothetical protein VLY63_04275 [Anaerolineae bacterium]|nr:hypothetical protein [Anaerolineae bacterium]